MPQMQQERRSRAIPPTLAVFVAAVLTQSIWIVAVGWAGWPGFAQWVPLGLVSAIGVGLCVMCAQRIIAIEVDDTLVRETLRVMEEQLATMSPRDGAGRAVVVTHRSTLPVGHVWLAAYTLPTGDTVRRSGWTWTGDGACAAARAAAPR